MINKEIELKVKQVFESQTKAGVYGILLEELNEPLRQLAIVVGEKEAHAIFCAVNNIKSARPLTHDLMISSFDFANIDLLKVLIYKMDVGVYYSYIYLKREEDFTRIDCRTSDALALALRADAPIYISEDILQDECVEEVVKAEDVDSIAEQIEGQVEQKEQEKEILQQKLDQAIVKEDYELASILRDRIAELG